MSPICPAHGVQLGDRSGRCPKCVHRQANLAWEAHPENLERKREASREAMRRLRARRRAEAGG